MSDTEKRFFPTSSKLEELREQGILPYSPAAAVWIAIGLTVIVIYSSAGSIKDFFNSWRDALKAGQEVILVMQLCLQLLKGLALGAIIIGVGVWLAGMLQTRGWFGLEKLAFSSERLWDARKINPLSLLLSFLFNFLCFILAAISGVVLVRAYAPDLFRIINADPQALSQWIKELGKAILWGVATASVALILVSLLVGRFIYLYKNRMTRDELEQELRLR